MNVLVTGAAGFIGSHVTRLLVDEGVHVDALMRDRVNSWRITDLISRVRVVECDLRDPTALDSYLRTSHPDVCIHLAWYAVPGQYLTSLENVSILSASLRLATRLASAGCRRFVAIGTCYEYDTNLGRLSETSPTRPRHLYASCKLALQQALDQVMELTHMQVAWPRLFFQYGPFEDPRRLVPSVICSLLKNQPAAVTSGNQVRDYLHVRDVASAIWAVARSDLVGPVNIGSGTPVRVRDLVLHIGELLGKPELVRLGARAQNASDPPFICADIGRLLTHTDWRPQYALDEGLRMTTEWWRHHVVASTPLAEVIP